MRLLNLPVKNHDALIHDVIKNTVILIVIETMQTLLSRDSFFDKQFVEIVLYTVLGNLIYYLIVDRYIVGAGPVLSGAEENRKAN